MLGLPVTITITLALISKFLLVLMADTGESNDSCRLTSIGRDCLHAPLPGSFS